MSARDRAARDRAMLEALNSGNTAPSIAAVRRIERVKAELDELATAFAAVHAENLQLRALLRRHGIEA